VTGSGSLSPTGQVSPAGRPRSASRPGSGLGLAIAAEVASAHGGTALARLTSPHGLLVTLTVPVHRPSGSRSARELAASVG
jgi:signal transduction histidine kinase